ncbi:MAG TPA: hypothetical protein VKV19_02780 [Ktedonobacteraceae bacterium]|jgi:ABC-type transport system involved in multi-copper enzyme maturation permease subunit|nr:hypothetical protein [Ktedonobacteraceae bacterium]
MAINPISPEQTFPQADRSASVEMGRRDYLSTVWRLTRMELYKLYRRRYSQIVLATLLGLVASGVVVIGFFDMSQANAPASNFAPPRCVSLHNGQQYCSNQTFSQAQLERAKTAAMQENAQSLGLPGSLTAIVTVLSINLITTLGILLLGPLVGTEYGMGTIRLLFTRGPTRLQCMLAKVVAALIYTMVALLLVMAAYIVLGMIFYPMTGEPYSYTFSFFSQADFRIMLSNALLLGLIDIVYWFTYGVMALFFGSIGRSTAAAIGGTFAWYTLEILLIYLLEFLQGVIPTGALYTFFKGVPDYLLFNNLNSLVQNRLHFLNNGNPLSSISDLHACIVVAVYLVVLVGASCLITMRRDVTS